MCGVLFTWLLFWPRQLFSWCSKVCCAATGTSSTRSGSDDPLPFTDVVLHAIKSTTNEPPTRERRTDEEQWTTSRWLESVDLGRHVAESLVRPLKGRIDTSAAHDLSSKELAYLRTVAEVGSPQEIKNLLAEGDLISKLAIEIWDALQDLASQSASTSFELHQKFQQEPNTFNLTYSGLETYFNGLEGFLGPPCPDVHRQMEREHGNCPDSHASYEATNYGTTTTAHVEWRFVVSPTDEALRELGLTEWPLESKLHSRPSKQRYCRHPTPLSAFSEELTARNSQLTSLGHPPLLDEEVIGARLYTGPQFVKYNAVLRGLQSENPYLKSQFTRLCMGNTYSTTLHVINSCIVKLAMLGTAEKVYRGISGGLLPDEFWTANQFNVRGGVECGFLSTTLDRQVALDYASQSGMGVVFEIQQGMVDRGCDVSWLSQYPHESEILFAPLCGMEVQRTRVEGGAIVIETRLSINLKSLTMEQQIGRRRKLVVDMSEHINLEMRSEVKEEAWTTLAAQCGLDAGSLALEQLGALLKRVSGAEAAMYNDNDAFRTAVGHVISAKQAYSLWPSGLVKLNEALGADGHPGAPELLLARETLNAGHKQVYLEELCGLMVLLALNPRLTELDAQWNSLYEDGGRAMSESLRHNETLTSLNLSTNWVGAEAGAWLANALAVNRGLTTVDLSYNKIGEHGGLAMAVAIRSNSALKLLNLNLNEIGDCAANEIARSLSDNEVLESLKMDTNGLTAACAQSFCDGFASLPPSRRLLSLSLASNNFDEASLEALATAASPMSVLELNLGEPRAGFIRTEPALGPQMPDFGPQMPAFAPMAMLPPTLDEQDVEAR